MNSLPFYPNKEKGLPMKMKTWLAVGMVFLILGCAPALRQRITDKSYTDKISEGTTTKEEIRNMFGEPNVVIGSPDGDMWGYDYAPDIPLSLGRNLATSLLGTSPMVRANLTVWFDQAGVVKNKSTTANTLTR